MNTRPNPAGPPSHTLKLQQFIRAPRQRVYKAWIDPVIRMTWCKPFPDMFCDRCEIDARTGGNYRLNVRGPANPGVREEATEHRAFGAFTEVIPNERLVFTWSWEKPDPMADDSADSLVTVEFRDAPGGTMLTLTHERFKTGETRDGHLIGWTGCVDALAHLFGAQA